jgi:CheY-like chemotaxis protein
VANKKILIVEDDKDMHRVLNVRLRVHGYHTHVASDVFQAITLARAEKPDLILLDLGLPAGGGFTVMERLQDTPALAVIPVIVLTARERAGNEERALKGGAVAFLQKPVDNAHLLSAIRQALGEATSAESEPA